MPIVRTTHINRLRAFTPGLLKLHLFEQSMDSASNHPSLGFSEIIDNDDITVEIVENFEALVYSENHN